MTWAALASGGKDPILSSQKTSDSGETVEYLVTARLKNRDTYMSADRVSVIADIVIAENMRLLIEGHTDEELAGEDRKFESTLQDARFYSRPITFDSFKIVSESNCNELVPGGFA
jgi:diphthamide synthase (EF-2-diphthine--ammonia ligase)